MAYDIPWELLPLVRALGVQWPDINEDAVSDLGFAFRDFGTSVSDLGWTVADHLGVLERECHSQTLHELALFWGRLQTEVLNRVDAYCGDIAVLCDDASAAVSIYKTALLGWLTLELGYLALTFPESLPSVIALRVPLEMAAEGLLQEATDKLTDLFVRQPEAIIKDEMGKIATKAFGTLEDAAYARLAQVVPEGHMGTLEDELFIDAQALIAAKAKIEKSMGAVEKAAHALRNAPHKVDHSKPHSHFGADSRLRKVAVALLRELADLLTDTATDLCNRLLDRVTGVLTAHEDYLKRVDALLAQQQPSANHAAVASAGVVAGSLVAGGTIVATFSAPPIQGIPLQQPPLHTIPLDGGPTTTGAASPAPPTATGFEGDGASFYADWRPSSTASAFDQWGFGYNRLDTPTPDNAGGDCTSFVAWRLNKIAAAHGLGDMYFANSHVGQVHGQLGNAGDWGSNAKGMGFVPDNNPVVGAVVHTAGHVAIVTSISDGQVVVEDSSAPYTTRDGVSHPGYVYGTHALTVRDGRYMMNGSPCDFIHFLPGT